MARNTSHPQSLDADNIGVSSEKKESSNSILCAMKDVTKTAIAGLTALSLTSCTQGTIADKKQFHQPIQIADASGESIVLASKQAEKIQQVDGKTKVEKVIVPTVRKQALKNQENVELSDIRGAIVVDEEPSSNKLDLRGNVSDSEGEVQLVNYEKKPNKLSKNDIQQGIIELSAGFVSDGDTQEQATQDAIATIGAFLNNKNDGGAEYIAKYAPKFTEKILKNPDQYKLAIVLDTEMKKIKIAAGEAKIAAGEAKIAAGEARIESLNKLSKTLKGE